MRAKIQKLLTVIILTLSIQNAWSDGFPSMPDERLTQGSLCEHGDSHRYPEEIEYCERSVSVAKKWDIIDQYESLGYEIRDYGRENFKIDHLIPLCAGGSNDVSNLWPQHKSIYEKTDRIEEMACRLMAQGKLTQSEAVELILSAKRHVDTACDVEEDLAEKLAAPTPDKEDSVL